MIEVIRFILWRLELGGDVAEVIHNPEKYFIQLNADEPTRTTIQAYSNDDWRRVSETLFRIFKQRSERNKRDFPRRQSNQWPRESSSFPQV